MRKLIPTLALLSLAGCLSAKQEEALERDSHATAAQTTNTTAQDAEEWAFKDQDEPAPLKQKEQLQARPSITSANEGGRTAAQTTNTTAQDTEEWAFKDQDETAPLKQKEQLQARPSITSANEGGRNAQKKAKRTNQLFVGDIATQSAPMGSLDSTAGAVAMNGRRGRANSMTKRRPIRRPVPIMLSERSTEEYTDHGVNPFTSTEKDALSTFSIDVDTASYTIARRKLTGGVLPPWESVRVEEFVNYLDYSYSSPKKQPFHVDMAAMPDPFRKGHHVMRVGVQAKRYSKKDRPAVHLTFLADVSGSMSSADKLPLAKQAMHTMVDNLRPDDTIALVTYAGRVAEILAPTSVENSATIHRAIDSLNSGGSTAMSSGIDLAYQMAMKSFEEGAENRVVIMSDGDANVGRTSWDAMLSQIKGYADKGVTLSTIGFGMGNYRDTLMEQLANKGDGNNFYIDSKREADRVFSEKIASSMITVARDVKIQVEFNEDAVRSYRLIGYENRNIADRDFRNDRVDAGEVGSGHSVTALYEVVLADEGEEDLATVRLRYEKPGADGEARELSFPFKGSAMVDDISNADRSLRLAYASATFAEVLRQSPHAAEVELSDLAVMVKNSAKTEDDRELARLMFTAKRLGATATQASWTANRR